MFYRTPSGLLVELAPGQDPDVHWVELDEAQFNSEVSSTMSAAKQGGESAANDALVLNRACYHELKADSAFSRFTDATLRIMSGYPEGV